MERNAIGLYNYDAQHLNNIESETYLRTSSIQRAQN